MLITNADRVGRPTGPWKVFALVATAQFMVVLDTAIINVALPVIKRDLDFGDSTIQWVVTAYVLAFGGFLLLGGRLADLLGRRRTLLMGMAAFTVVSLLIGVNSSVPLLIVLRGLQGLAAAVMSPAALSTVLTQFPEGHERSRALGFWSMVATGGAAVGLLLGGVLTQYAGWRWNFFINVPVGVIVLALVPRLVPDHRPGSRDRRGLPDAPGAVLATAGLMAGVFAFSQAPEWGWANPLTLICFAACVILLAAFVFNERRAADPLVDLGIFTIRNVSGANGMMATVFAGNLGMFFLLTLYMQDIEHYSAIRTGLAFLPFPVILGLVSTRMAGLVRRFGFRRFLIMGPVLVIIGMLWVSFLPVHGSYAVHVLPGLLVMPLGYGMSFAPMYAAATAGTPQRFAGVTSGLIATSQQAGGALGLAVISGTAGTVTASLTHDALPQALTSGYNVAMAVAAGITAIAGLLAALVIRTPRRADTPVEPSVPGPSPQPASTCS
ncbi:putative MFS-type transporter EfpA [Streptomyces sp. RB17]|uniref:MFS transporter n=1 Tax=Streptomyces sp. RB17 TaxID=2585197 RepID=UPI0012976FAB|nr:MFS transporter [Streptomyces sp. RB17]MQY40012.1 putative MFS-type transporter EfpA [Streptomyces sp. RB17]